MPDVSVRMAGRVRGRRGVSGIGIVLVVIGVVALLVSFSVLPPAVDQLWPVIVIAVGMVGLLRRPGWIEELDIAVPGAGGPVRRPRRGFSWFLIGAGLLLLLITTRAVDQRVIGASILIALGILLLWRRWR